MTNAFERIKERSFWTLKRAVREWWYTSSSLSTTFYRSAPLTSFAKPKANICRHNLLLKKKANPVPPHLTQRPRSSPAKDRFRRRYLSFLSSSLMLSVTTSWMPRSTLQSHRESKLLRKCRVRLQPRVRNRPQTIQPQLPQPVKKELPDKPKKMTPLKPKKRRILQQWLLLKWFFSTWISYLGLQKKYRISIHLLRAWLREKKKVLKYSHKSCRLLKLTPTSFNCLSNCLPSTSSMVRLSTRSMSASSSSSKPAKPTPKWKPISESLMRQRVCSKSVSSTPQFTSAPTLIHSFVSSWWSLTSTKTSKTLNFLSLKLCRQIWEREMRRK